MEVRSDLDGEDWTQKDFECIFTGFIFIWMSYSVDSYSSDLYSSDIHSSDSYLSDYGYYASDIYIYRNQHSLSDHAIVRHLTHNVHLVSKTIPFWYRERSAPLSVSALFYLVMATLLERWLHSVHTVTYWVRSEFAPFVTAPSPISSSSLPQHLAYNILSLTFFLLSYALSFPFCCYLCCSLRGPFSPHFLLVLTPCSHRIDFDHRFMFFLFVIPLCVVDMPLGSMLLPSLFCALEQLYSSRRYSLSWTGICGRTD